MLNNYQIGGALCCSAEELPYPAAQPGQLGDGVLNYLGRREDLTRNRASWKVNDLRTLAAPEDKSQVGASIPGAVSKIDVKVGDTVEKNQTIVTIEAMKMETAITARAAGTVKSVRVKEGQPVKAKELLMVLE